MVTAPTATQFCDEMKVNRFHWAIIVLGLSGLTFGGYTLHVLSYVMPGIIQEWHLSHVAAGTAVSWGLVGNGLGTVGLGMLADRVGRKSMFILSLIIYCVFTGAMGWVHSFGVFSALRFLAGIGIGGATILNITIASEFAPAKVRARMVTAMFTGLMIGPVICGIVSMLVIPTYGWRVILMLNLVPLILVPFLIIFLPESVRFLVQKGRHEKAVKILRRMEKAAHIEPMEWSAESFVLPDVVKKVSVERLFTSKLAFMTILIWLAYILNHVALYGVT
ncbi:MAG: MFS transporter, partial [Methanoregula sp.]|uniref:MFS transporter n=1 Tax=Methanoregula sp. TaxID=2052170 RepID=UPI003D0CBB92